MPSEKGDAASANQTYGTFKLKVPLDSKIWRSISARTPHSHRISDRIGSVAAAPSTSMFGNARNAVHSYQYSKPWNTFSDICMSQTLSIDVVANGLICIRRTDNIL